MRSFWVVLPLTFAFLFAAAPVALCQSRAAGPGPGVTPYMVAAITVNVTAPPPHAGPRTASGGSPEIKLVNGKPLMRLTAEFNGQTIEAPQGTYILLRFSAQSGALGFTVSPPGILEAPKGIYHLPEGAIGMLRATHTGTARVLVQGIQPRPGRSGLFNRTSPNWSGYAKTGGPGAFLMVTGEWTVPTVSSDGGDHSSTWIGIDGFANDNLIQTGTEQDVGFFGPNYYAWWEVLPDELVEIPHPVSPGDHMIAVIHLIGIPAPGSPMEWRITLNNATKNWHFSKVVTYSGDLTSAEWIVERPTECGFFSCSLTSLADYGQAAFDVFDTVNNISPVLVPSESITLTQGDKALSTPSDPDGDQDGFTVAYGAQKPPPPGPLIVTKSLPDAFLNTPYRARLLLSGDSIIARWFGSGLPAWLALDRLSGMLSGTPPAVGLNFFSVIARDAVNPNVSSQLQPLEITVQPTPPPNFSLSAAPQAVHLFFSGGHCSGSTTITVNPLFGFTSPVELSAAGPGLASAQFSPATTTGTSHLTMRATFCRATGDQDTFVNVTGTAGAITHSTVVDLVPLSSSQCSTARAGELPICP